MPKHSSVFHSISTLEIKVGVNHVRLSPVSLATVQDCSVEFWAVLIPGALGLFQDQWYREAWAAF